MAQEPRKPGSREKGENIYSDMSYPFKLLPVHKKVGDGSSRKLRGSN